MPPEKQIPTSDKQIFDDSAFESSENRYSLTAPGTALTKAKKPLAIVLWFLGTVLLVCVGFAYLIGTETMLQHAALVKPYALPLLKTHRISSADTLIFFFGDSTLIEGANEDGRSITEVLESELTDKFPELGDVAVVKKAFGSARLFHFYCLMFQTERFSPDLLIIPINWFWLGSNSDFWTRKYRFRQLANLVPISEQFRSEPGNPLKREKISLSKHLIYSFDIYSLYARGGKLWMREKLGLPNFRNVRDETSSWVMWANEGQPGRTIDEEFERYSFYVMMCPDHPSVDLLCYVARTAEKRNIRVLFYINPIQFERVQKSPDFNPELFDCSLQLLIDTATTRTTKCVDLSRLLDQSQFINALHYNFSGHVDIAETLAPEVYKMLSTTQESD